MYRGGHCILSRNSILKISLSLSQTETKLGIFNQCQGVTFTHFLVFIEIDLLDKALHAAIDGDNQLFYLCIVSISYTAEVDKMRAYPHQPGNK